MDTAAGPKLLQQAEKILLHPIHPHLISYCPTMDLIALVTDEENLDVYRINGQRAFGLKRRSEDERVEAVAWQGNGACVAVAWSGGAVDVVGCETGKVVHRDVRLRVDGEEGGGRVTCLGWGLNFIDVEGVKRRTGLIGSKAKDEAASDQAGTPGPKKKADGSEKAKKTIDFNFATTEDWDAFKDDTTLEDFLQRQPDFETLDIAPDLPDQLAMMDMETLLPKLPPIPLPPANPFMMMRGAQADAGAFSTQAQVDGLLHSHHLRDHNSVDMFIRCTENGTVHPSIYDSMETVDIRLPEAWGVQSSPIMHASHPYACTHGLLMSITKPQTQQKRIAYVPLTLGFIPSAGIYLHLIASKTAQLQNLLSYLTHTLSRIRTFFTHSQDLPGKFMRNISDTLAENNEGALVQNLYHLACTGHCPPLIHEWLVDELAEQGHKRWDNAVSSGLATVIQLLHENFLPALDRCSIIISRLRGLATYYEDQDWIFSGPIADFTALLDLLKNLRLLGHITLLYAADEKKRFASFSKWLRYVIDFEATEPVSQSRAEMEARDPGVDISIVLEYIQFGMTRSDLGPFLRAKKDVGGGEAAVGYEDTRKAIEVLREGGPVREEALCLEMVLGLFGEGVHDGLKQVSQWQENNISMDCGLILEEGDVGDAVDMRMVYEPSSAPTPADPNADSISTYIALTTPTHPSQLHIHRLAHSPRLTSLPASLHTYAQSTLTTPTHKILDAKFADDTNLLILLQATEDPKTCSLISLPYTLNPTTSPSTSSGGVGTTTTTSSTTTKNSIINYTPLPPTLLLNGTSTPTPSSHTSTPLPLSPHLLAKHTRHTFEGRFTPLKLVVNGRKGRRVVVVLGSDRKHYRVLDLDFRERKRTGAEVGVGEDPVGGRGRGSGKGGAGEGGESASEWESDDDGSLGSDVDVEMGGA
ncbi:hypothetical protein K458DRAFT_377414 [Lentithecium fluviatile CBS 122367]|uniref:Anaphase-promoting complex subunit 4 n=1 Tax=Lentithecium fluviatile CBS 122367 TaxID=1168545 RepID=A0A6G1IJI5_9PLEO|nr:hypothetical protein K458DRAFT_377414 [Lentithecium fluviatile CBS 122367]